jgi:hypothetical protein
VKEDSGSIRIDYHVLLSPTWQVPVLYFSPVWNKTSIPLSLNETYESIVEHSSRNVIEEVGVMGGISHGVTIIRKSQMLTTGSSAARNTVLLHTSLSNRRTLK